MQLTYRGVTYDYNPVEVEYRGLSWQFRNPKKAPILKATLDLKYRGSAYHLGSSPMVEPQPHDVSARVEPQTAPIAAAPSNLSLADKARLLMMHHGHAIKVRQQAMLERSAEKVGLTMGTSDYWNRIQGKVHPTFRLTYDRSGATLS